MALEGVGPCRRIAAGEGLDPHGGGGLWSVVFSPRHHGSWNLRAMARLRIWIATGAELSLLSAIGGRGVPR